jgi:hypothetical protein
MVEVQHEHITTREMRESSPEWWPVVDLGRVSVELGARRIEGRGVAAVDDVERIVRRRVTAHGLRHGGPEAAIVERAGDPEFELNAPGRCLGVEEIFGPGFAVGGVPHPFTVEPAPVVALTAPEQQPQVVGHAGQVVGRGLPNRIPDGVAGTPSERGNPVDMGGDVVAVNDDVKAVRGDVLAKRHTSRMQDASEPAVTVEAPGALELTEEALRVSDPRVVTDRRAGIDEVLLDRLESGLEV